MRETTVVFGKSHPSFMLGGKRMVMGAISVNLPFFVSHLNRHFKAICGVPLFIVVNIRSFARAPAAMRDT